MHSPVSAPSIFSGISMSVKASARYGSRHEGLALDHEEQVEHGLIEHVPWPDLLLDHVEARFLEVQTGSHSCSRSRCVPQHSAKVYQRVVRVPLRLATRFARSVASFPTRDAPCFKDVTNVSIVASM